MRGQLPDISPSSGAFRATFPPKGEGFVLRGFPAPLFSLLGIDSPAQMCYTGFIACNEIISRES